MVGFILLPLKCSINFSLNLLGTGLLYLLDIMMNSSFMPVHQLVCHLDLNWIETQGSHAFSELALTVNFISNFWQFESCLNFEILSFWFSCSPWNLEWMFLLYLFHLIHSSLLAYCSVLSVHSLSVSWLQSRYFVMFSAYVFITNMVAKIFVPTNRLTSSQVPANEKRQY